MLTNIVKAGNKKARSPEFFFKKIIQLFQYLFFIHLQPFCQQYFGRSPFLNIILRIAVISYKNKKASFL